jgi:hypothetical protein
MRCTTNNKDERGMHRLTALYQELMYIGNEI